MATYPLEHRKALGEYIRKVRAERGFADIREWMDATGRSDRYLLGLERGEPVGPKTIKVVAKELGLDEGDLFRILNTGQAPPVLGWGKVADLEDHTADLAGMLDMNLMFSQAVRFAATAGVLVPEVREEAERVSAALSALFSHAYQAWDRKPPLDRDDLWADDPIELQLEKEGEAHDRAAASQVPESGPAEQPDRSRFTRATRDTKRAPRNVEDESLLPDDEGPEFGA